jgi:hypothetical protein
VGHGVGDAQTRRRPVRPMWCEIRVQGHLDGTWSDWFDGLTVTNAERGESVLAGSLPDQAALHGLLIRVRDLGLPLLTVICTEPDRGEDPSALATDRMDEP